MNAISRRAAVVGSAAALGADLLEMLADLGVQLDARQRSALAADVPAFIARRSADLQALSLGTCCVCGCLMANTRCGHSCCCVV